MSKKVTLIYTGKRVGRGGKLLQTFLHGKKAVAFSGLSRLVIGWGYEAEVRDGDLTIARKPTSVSRGEGLDTREWEAMDAAAVQQKRDERVASEARKDRQIMLEIDGIRDYTKNMDFGERRAFLEFLLHELSFKKRSAR
jgi:hypothetical protein